MAAKVVLQSWKEISAFVGRTERTLQRWEQQFGFPVHRPSSKLRSSVMALSEEIQEWTRDKPSLSIRKNTSLESTKVSGKPRSKRGTGNLQAQGSQDAPFRHRTLQLVNNQESKNTLMERIQSSRSLWEKQKDLHGDIRSLLEAQLKLHEELRRHLDVFRAPKNAARGEGKSGFQNRVS